MTNSRDSSESGAGDPGSFAPEHSAILLDVMCGGLTAILRMVGYDTVYAMDRDAEDDETLLGIATDEGRIVVTRDRQVAARDEDAILLEATETDAQLAELQAAGFELVLSEPRRCGSCNGELAPVATSQAAAEELPDGVPDPSDGPLWQCEACGQYFWKGSHWGDVGMRLEGLNPADRD